MYYKLNCNRIINYGNFKFDSLTNWTNFRLQNIENIIVLLSMIDYYTRLISKITYQFLWFKRNQFLHESHSTPGKNEIYFLELTSQSYTSQSFYQWVILLNHPINKLLH